MAASMYASADYQAALLALLPRGRVWPKDLSTVQAQLAAGLAPSFSRHDQRAQQLLQDAFPSIANELLPEWEASLGLPDPCAGQSPTVQQRQAQVVARLTDTGGQSAARFTGLAAQLGFAVTVSAFAPFRAGRSSAGEACCGPDWIHTWRITSPLNAITPFRAGLSRAGEALGVWGSAVLECELKARAPAHTILQFAYTGLSGILNFSDPDQSAFIGAL